jgi:hypothetical protein
LEVLVANSLLDFVMSLVRDPDAAAHYAANPAQAIADANLTDVTSADVNHLIPVVAESMSTIVPSGNVAAGGDDLLDAAHNVWASGAATAAFDAFDDHLPIQGDDAVAARVPMVTSMIDHPAESAPTIVDHGLDDTGMPSIQAPDVDLPVHGDVQDLHDVQGFDAAAAASEDVHHVFTDISGAEPVAGSGAEDEHLDHPQDSGFDIFT